MRTLKAKVTISFQEKKCGTTYGIRTQPMGVKSLRITTYVFRYLGTPKFVMRYSNVATKLLVGGFPCADSKLWKFGRNVNVRVKLV